MITSGQISIMHTKAAISRRSHNIEDLQVTFAQQRILHSNGAYTNCTHSYRRREPIACDESQHAEN